MKKYLYDIYQTTEKNGCTDLTFGLAMLLYDARTGARQYGPEDTDYDQLHADSAALHEQEGMLRRFMGRHGRTLADAFQTHDRAVFDAAVAACVAQDEAREKEKQEAQA